MSKYKQPPGPQIIQDRTQQHTDWNPEDSGYTKIADGVYQMTAGPSVTTVTRVNGGWVTNTELKKA